MSQAEDMSAINDYFNRTPGKTPSAKDAKLSWSAWYNGLNFMQKSFSGDTYAEAVKRRTTFNAANGEPALQNDGGLTPEEAQYFLNLPVADVTGKTPAQAAIITAAARKKGQAMKVPASLTAAGYNVDMSTPASANAASTTSAVALVQARGTIKLGSKGALVKEWQAIVKDRVTGIFDKPTESATKKFQAAHAIKADGVVGPATWTAALGTSPAAPAAVANATPGAVKPPVATGGASAAKPKPSAPAAKPAATGILKPKPKATAGTPGTSRPTIKLGSTGAAVLNWQGYLGVPVTGNFDDVTQAATKKWQANYGLVADGIVGPSSWAKADSVSGTFSMLSLSGVQVQTASMFGGLTKLPSWAKWTLGVISLGAIAYGLKNTKMHPNQFGQKDLDREREGKGPETQPKF
jgi:peptidoglycan hydrolase-like protein with peptidoglycan-binding domain